MPNLGPLEITLILLVIILLFGARKLPEAAKGLGQSLKIFKKEVREDEKPAPPAQAGPPAALPPAQPTVVQPTVIQPPVAPTQPVQQPVSGTEHQER